MYKQGDILYFITTESLTFRPKAIFKIQQQPEVSLGFGDIRDKDKFVHMILPESTIIVDPNLSDSKKAGLRIEDISNRGYLIFSTAEKAVDALTNHIIPALLEKQLLVVDKKREDFHTELSKFESLELLLKKLKGEID